MDVRQLAFSLTCVACVRACVCVSVCLRHTGGNASAIVTAQPMSPNTSPTVTASAQLGRRLLQLARNTPASTPANANATRAAGATNNTAAAAPAASAPAGANASTTTRAAGGVSGAGAAASDPRELVKAQPAVAGSDTLAALSVVAMRPQALTVSE